MNRPFHRRRSPADTRVFARRGRWFQDQVDRRCKAYQLAGTAFIWPVPVPMRLKPNRTGSYFLKKSTTDYLGFLADSRGVAFDAKSTTGRKWEASVPQHQIDTLALVAKLGHLAGLLIGYEGQRGDPPQAVWIPWPAAQSLTMRSGWTYDQCLALPGALTVPWRMTFDFLPTLETSARSLPPLTIGERR